LKSKDDEPLSIFAFNFNLRRYAVGVVLTGGGGHGLAHLGALRALEDSGVPIDCVGGTSQGALMAGAYTRPLFSST
jgi:lysophospholipid hydrolase